MDELINKYRIIFGAYLGIALMDEYELKPYVLDKIEKYIKNYIVTNPIDNFDYDSFMSYVNQTSDTIVKLQDALRLSQIIDYPLELVYLLKKKIRDLKNDCSW